VLGDLGYELLAEPGTDEAPQVARDVLPAFDPGPHLAVWLLDRGLHPLDPLLDYLVNGLALLVLLHLLLTQGFGDGLAAPGFQRVDLAAGILDRERFRVVDAKPAGTLLAGLLVGELDGEGCHASRGDADIEARAFAVVEFDPLGDPLFAQAVGEDDAAISRALGSWFGRRDNIRHGFSS
jgi:hypothetical protein